MKNTLSYPLAALVALLASTASAAPITSAPSGDFDRSGSVSTADLQCLLRTVVTWGEFEGSGGTLHGCTTVGAPCADPVGGHCAAGFGSQHFCTPACVAPDVVFAAAAGTCSNTNDPPPVIPTAACHRSVSLRQLDLNCDGRLGSGDLSFLAQILLRHPPDIDGDGALNFCDPDSDGDGALDTADCAPLDNTVYPGAPELCDNQFNGCPPGGVIDIPPYEGDPACALRYGPIIYGFAPEVLTPGAQVIVIGAFFDAASAEVRIDGVLQTAVVSSPTQISFIVDANTNVGNHTLAITTATGTSSMPVVVAGIPDIGTLTPTLPVSGGSLTITGQDLAGSTVTVCGINAQTLSSTTSQVVVLLDPYTPLGSCVVTVSTPLGGDSDTVQVQVGPPFVDYAVPNPVLAGEILEIVGTNLTGATATLGGQLLQIVASEDGRLAVIIPTQLPQDNADIIITTANGTVTITVFVTPVPLGGPEIGAVSPTTLIVGELATITGDWLKDAVITLGGIPVEITSMTNTSVEFIVPANAPVGTLSLVVSTSLGIAQQAVAITAVPTVSAIAPNPAVAGQPLAVVGTYLAGFTSLTIGGVKQFAFSQVSQTKLVMIVSPTTPIGLQPLVVTTPGGTATLQVQVAPQNSGPPEILDITPSSAKAGDTITITGSGLAGVTWLIGGVPHAPKVAGNDLLVELVLDADVLYGDQLIVADKGTYGNTSGSLFVILAPPRLEFVRTSALGVGGRLALVFLPGAVAPGAAIDIGYAAGQYRTIMADGDGAAGTLFEGLTANTSFTLAQGVPGNVSEPVAYAQPAPAPNAPEAPHPYLVRAETRSNGKVEVFGPAPAFGDGDEEVFVVGEASMATATAAQFYADPNVGLQVDLGSASAVGVFTFGDGASPVMATTPIPLDLPLLSSAPRLGRICVAGLAGSVPSGAVVTLSAAALTSSGDAGTMSAPITAFGADGTFVSVSDVTDVGVSIASVTWDGTLNGTAFQTATPTGLLPLSLGAADVGVGPGPGGTTVSLASVPKGRLVIVSSAAGDVIAAEGTGGPISVTLPGNTPTVYVFLFEPTDGRTSPCVAVSP